MAFTFVQKNVNGVTSNGGSSLTVAVTQTGTAGHLAFGFVTAADATQTCTVKDSNGVSATMVPSSSGLLDSGNGTRSWMYYFDGITGSPTSVTATFSLTSTTRSITYQEWSGQASPSFDQSNLSNVASSTTPTGTAVTPGVNGELIFAAIVPDSGNATTISIGNNVAWTIRNNPDGNGASDESFIQATAASITGKFGFSTAQASQLGIMTFKPAAGAFVGPFPQRDWPTPRPPEPYPYRSWEFRNSRGLLGKDILPHRQQDWPLPGAPEPDWRRSWTWSYNLNLIGKDVLPHRQMDWPNPVPPFRIEQTWLQDPLTLRTLTLRLPFNQFDWPNPQPVIWYRDWSQNLAQFAPVSALPHNQFDWPIPQPVTWYRDWSLNLLQTTLAPTQILMALPPIWDLPEPAAEIDRFYTQNLLTTTLAPAVVLPFRQQDWPLPAQLTWYREWSQNLLQTTLKPPVVQLPFNQYDWPLPARPFYPLPDINWQNPLVLGIPIPPPVTGFHYVTTSRAKLITTIGVS